VYTLEGMDTVIISQLLTIGYADQLTPVSPDP